MSGLIALRQAVHRNFIASRTASKSASMGIAPADFVIPSRLEYDVAWQSVHNPLMIDSTWQNAVAHVKRKHRSSLSLEQWERYKYAEHFREWVATFRQNHVPRLSCNEHIARHQPHHILPVDRIQLDEFDVDTFREVYENTSTPCIIQGCMNEWPSYRNSSHEQQDKQQPWSFDMFCQPPFDNLKLKAGEDDAGCSTKISAQDFISYMRNNNDDSPLYVFDSAFAEHDVGKKLLDGFFPPIYFRDDLFALVPNKRRPPYRWCLIGPERSGSSLHTDPLSTSAWNSCLIGQKLWVLFPPHCSKEAVKGNHLRFGSEDGEACTYFLRVLPRILEEERRRPHPQLGCRLFIQYPGETVFIPSMWHHAVLNLRDTLAVTENFCSLANFDSVWRSTRTSRKHMARRWLWSLEDHIPHLASRALHLNMVDNFRFVFSDGSSLHRHDPAHTDRCSRRSVGDVSVASPSKQQRLCSV